MVFVEGCAASCLFPIFNGNSMGNQKVIAKSAIANLARQSQVGKNVRQCSNKNGKCTRCTRPAWKNWKRCEPCFMSNRRSIKRRWMKRCVDMCILHDKVKFTWDTKDYVNEEHMKWMYKTFGRICYWCGKQNLSIENRLGNDGLQLERLNNSLPHLKRNCVFACGMCNRRSWKRGWKKEPHHLAKIPKDPRLSHRSKVLNDMVCLEIKSRNAKV